MKYVHSAKRSVFPTNWLNGSHSRAGTRRAYPRRDYPEKLRLVRESDAVLREEIAQAGLSDSIWQYFTVFPNVRTVGAMGDGRTYDNLIAIRAVTSVDAMTVEVAEIPYPLLQKIALRIVNEVKASTAWCTTLHPSPRNHRMGVTVAV